MGRIYYKLKNGAAVLQRIGGPHACVLVLITALNIIWLLLFDIHTYFIVATDGNCWLKFLSFCVGLW